MSQRDVFARVAAGEQIDDRHRSLLDAISEAMRSAVKIQHRIEAAFCTSPTLDETGFLGLRLGRLLHVRELSRAAACATSELAWRELCTVVA